MSNTIRRAENLFFYYQAVTGNLNKIGTTPRLLLIIVIASGFILGGVVAVNVFHYNDIPLPWKIAITSFIVILPFSFFVQAALTIRSQRERRKSDIRKRLTEFYLKNRNVILHEISSHDLLNILDFRHAYQSIAGHIQDHKLYEYYSLSYEVLIEKERYILDRYWMWESKPKEEEPKKDLSDKIKHDRIKLLEFHIDDILDVVIFRKMREEGLEFASYLLPLSFFMFIYFAGFLVTIPFIDSVFTKAPNAFYIPILGQWTIPLIVIQWGFLGGLVYTSISLLNRFLRSDLNPGVYFHASFRLLLSAVVAVVIYFVYMFVYPTAVGTDKINSVPPYILLVCFLAGVAPIQLLVHFADTQLSRITGWRRRNVTGNRSLTQLEGISTVTAQRLSEDGIDSIQEMALCDPIELEIKTRFPLKLIEDWKEQALLYILSGDILVGKDKTDEEQSLYGLLRKRFGIRKISDLHKIWCSNTMIYDGKSPMREILLKGLMSTGVDNTTDLLSLQIDSIIKMATTNIQLPVADEKGKGEIIVNNGKDVKPSAISKNYMPIFRTSTE